MSRPSLTLTAFLLTVAALQFAGCKTIYTDTYGWNRSHYKPLQETPKEKDLLPASLPPPLPNEAPPPLPGGVAPAPDMGAPANPAPAIPGL